MKYKNIHSAIHNLGHSFLSSMNYVNYGYVIEDIEKIHEEKCDVVIDWICVTFEPASEATPRILKSLEYYSNSLRKNFERQNIEMERITMLKFRWPFGSRKFMEATDDRGKYYKIYVREPK